MGAGLGRSGTRRSPLVCAASGCCVWAGRTVGVRPGEAGTAGEVTPRPQRRQRAGVGAAAQALRR